MSISTEFLNALHLDIDLEPLKQNLHGNERSSKLKTEAKEQELTN